MWQWRCVTRKSLRLLVVSVYDWEWGKVGVAQWLSELERTVGCIQRVISTWALQSPSSQSRHSGDEGEAGVSYLIIFTWAVHPGIIQSGLPFFYFISILPFIYFISGFFPMNTRQPCGPISMWSHVQRNCCLSKKNVIQSNSNIHSASKEKAEQKEYILNVHQDIFKIHYSESLPFSIPSTEMAAASWNLTLHPSLEARPKPLYNIQPVWLTLQSSHPSLAQFSIMHLNLTSLAFLVGVSDFFPHGSYRKAETLVQVWILLLYEAKKMEKDWILIECYFFLVAWRSHRGGKSFLKGCHWFSPF